MTGKATCRGEKKDGQPCRSTIIGDDGFCDAHRPGNREEMRARARRGGKAKARKDAPRGLDTSKLPELEDHESVKVWLQALAAGVASGEVDRKRASELRKLLTAWVSVHKGEIVDEELEKIREYIAEIKRRRDDDWGPGA